MFLSVVFCEDPNSGSRDVSDSSVCSWDPFLHAGLPQSALISGFALSLTVTSVTVFSLYPWEVCFFLKGNGGGIDIGRELEGEIVIEMYYMREE